VAWLCASGALNAQPLDIAIERRLAERTGLIVGDTLRVSAEDRASTPARVAAIYEPVADPATIMRRDHHVRLHLAELAALLGQPDRLDRAGIILQPGANAEVVASRLNRTAFGYEVFPTAVVASQSSTTFLVVSRFHRAIAIISILASTVFLLCLMLLKVEERRLDVAVLRFTGISRRTIFLALVIESAIVAGGGSAIGVAIAAAAGAITNWYYQRAFDTSLIFSLLTPGTIGFAVTLSIVLGIGAGGLAGWRMVRTPPTVLWRLPG